MLVSHFLKAFRLPRQSGPPTQSRDPSQALQGARPLLPPGEDLLPHQNVLLLLLFILQTSHIILLLRAQTYVPSGALSLAFVFHGFLNYIFFWVVALYYFLFLKRTAPNYANGILSFSRLNANLDKQTALRERKRWRDSAVVAGKRKEKKEKSYLIHSSSSEHAMPQCRAEKRKKRKH